MIHFGTSTTCGAIFGDLKYTILRKLPNNVVEGQGVESSNQHILNRGGLRHASIFVCREDDRRLTDEENETRAEAENANSTKRVKYSGILLFFVNQPMKDVLNARERSAAECPTLGKADHPSDEFGRKFTYCLNGSCAYIVSTLTGGGHVAFNLACPE
jgi:hypothetical protein